jgi:hypothetical protein
MAAFKTSNGIGRYDIAKITTHALLSLLFFITPSNNKTLHNTSP